MLFYRRVVVVSVVLFGIFIVYIKLWFGIWLWFNVFYGWMKMGIFYFLVIWKNLMKDGWFKFWLLMFVLILILCSFNLFMYCFIFLIVVGLFCIGIVFKLIKWLGYLVIVFVIKLFWILVIFNVCLGWV